MIIYAKTTVLQGVEVIVVAVVVEVAAILVEVAVVRIVAVPVRAHVAMDVPVAVLMVRYTRPINE